MAIWNDSKADRQGWYLAAFGSAFTLFCLSAFPVDGAAAEDHHASKFEIPFIESTLRTVRGVPTDDGCKFEAEDETIPGSVGVDAVYMQIQREADWESCVFVIEEGLVDLAWVRKRELGRQNSHLVRIGSSSVDGKYAQVLGYRIPLNDRPNCKVCGEAAEACFPGDCGNPPHCITPHDFDRMMTESHAQEVESWLACHQRAGLHMERLAPPDW